MLPGSFRIGILLHHRVVGTLIVGDSHCIGSVAPAGNVAVMLK
jgi:hypothetical protein